MGAGEVRDHHDKGHPPLHGQKFCPENEEFLKCRSHANKLIQNSRGAEHPHQETTHLPFACGNRKGT